jgi:hypothetical protein
LFDVLQGDALFSYSPSTGRVATAFASDLAYSNAACTGSPLLTMNFDDTEGAPQFVSVQSRVVQFVSGAYSAWRLTGAYTENAPMNGGAWRLEEDGTCVEWFPVGSPLTRDQYVVAPATGPLIPTPPISVVQN